jgi:hypothetical protein
VSLIETRSGHYSAGMNEEVRDGLVRSVVLPSLLLGLPTYQELFLFSYYRCHPQAGRRVFVEACTFLACVLCTHTGRPSLFRLFMFP